MYERKEDVSHLKDPNEGNRDYRELLEWNISLPPQNRVMLLPIQRKVKEESESEEEDEEFEEEWKEFEITPIEQYSEVVEMERGCEEKKKKSIFTDVRIEGIPSIWWFQFDCIWFCSRKRLLFARER